MKILHLVFHPDLSASRVNKIWKKQLEGSGKVSTSRDMYEEYPNFKIDVAKEQTLLMTHDRVVIQFPMYWYSVPPLLKQWLDDVLTYNFAYGSKGDKLKGKDLQLFVSVGGRKIFYNGFDIFATVPELLRPFQLTANLTQMNYLLPEWMYRADIADTDTIQNFGNHLVELVDDEGRSDMRNFMNSKMAEDDIEVYDRSTLP